MKTYRVPSQENPLNEAAEVRHEDWKDESIGGVGLPEAPLTEVTEPPAKRPPVMRFVFIGPNGLRPGWGLLIFILLLVSIVFTVNFAVHKLHHKQVETAEQRKAEEAAGQKPSSMLIGESSSFAVVLLVSWIMGRIERRPLGRYGFGGAHKIGRFFAGFAWGFLFLAALVGALWKAGLLVFDGRLLFGAAMWKFGAIWMVGFLFVGLSEEYLLRGYLQYTIARGAASLYGMLFDTKHKETLGFWTAAAGLSFLFGFGHGNNPGESAIGLWSAGLIGLIFCFTLWKTGSLWWALGFHASWDWAQSFVFGVADSGTMVQGHLYASHPVGKVLLSGGTTGPEGSAFVLPVLVLIALVAVWTLPRREWSIEGAAS